ncbi:MAG: phosphoribosylamine--glycine ligase [Gemmatimonadaceae bacterium]
MKILLVGSGAREHALAWKFLRDDASAELLAAPGNPGIAELYGGGGRGRGTRTRCIAVAPGDLAGLTRLARAEQAALVVIGPEGPLAAGLADVLREHGVAVFGPSQRAARIESSKRFAKELMLDAGVPTAHASWHSDVRAAKRAAHSLGAPVVVKASGLASGKGVIVCETLADAERAIDLMLELRGFGEAGSEVLVEEFMEGEELSIFALTDGERFLAMLPAQDHKRLLDGDRGPNTGGMGAYAPVSIAREELLQQVSAAIFEPTLAALRDRGCRFAGLLYAGLMLTADGPKVVEFNCRFGDPESEAILPLLRSSLLEPVLAVARGDYLTNESLEWSSDCAVATVVAAPGYPDAPRIGGAIELPPPSESVFVFHAGTARDAAGRLVTAGGRVFAVTAVDADFDRAAARSAEAAAAISFPERQYRRDIGWRERERRARVT